ncbi:MAG: alpha/beta hydrolase [Candidatus Thorarchaeota archaeon]
MMLNRILRYLLLLFCYFCIAIFSFFTILYLFFDSTTFGWITAMVYSTLAPLLSPIYLISGIIIIRFSFMRRHREMIVISAICASLFIVGVIPYAAIPSSISSAEQQMINNYGTAYTDLDTTSMRSEQYSVFDNMYGVPIDDSKYVVETDIQYLNNGVDKFLFDWYRPAGDGPFPVIIAIHGGAWVIGNKGSSNSYLFNRYFASKGYAVFDLQYGLFRIDDLPEESQAAFGVFQTFSDLQSGPLYNGSYTMQHQIENIGYFTKMLELNSTKYAADLANVFIAGRSAGGHLTSLATLGHQNPLYAGNFSSSMTVRGGILFYPATDVTGLSLGAMAPLFEGTLPIEDQYDKLSPRFLIQNSTVTPPLMIVHGDKDGLANYGSQGYAFYQLAASLDKKCILVTIPWAGHNFDMNFHSYGGQMSIYYIERFIALELGGG